MRYPIWYFLLSLIVVIPLAIQLAIIIITMIKEWTKKPEDESLRPGEYINSSIPEVRNGYIEDKEKHKG